MRRRPTTLAVHRTDVAMPIAPPAAGRGRMWYDHEIADEFFSGLKGIRNPLRWVREHLPRGKRIKIGGSSAWFESDILAYIEALRESERLKDEERRVSA
jgi:hypothetical protein